MQKGENLSIYRSLFCSVCLLTATAISHAQASDNLDQRAPPDSEAAEAPFIAENNAAMERMMDGMAVKPTGNIDRDFVASMVAHHQGAIDMAVTMLKYGHNEQLKRMAQEIIVDQQQEITAMHQAVGDSLPPSLPAPTQVQAITP